MLAGELGHTIRTSTIDGAPQIVTMDFNPQRINVSVADGVGVGIDSRG